MRTIIDNKQFTCEPETNTITIYDNWQNDVSVSTDIVRGIAAATNTPPTELDPLYEVVDPDALDQLYQPSATNSYEHRTEYAAFRTNGCDVVVYSTGTIKITLADDEAN